MEIIKNGFVNERLGIELDVYVIEGKEWFKAKDVSDYLGYVQASDMLRNIDFIEENTTKHNVLSEHGNYSEVRFIDEMGIYECVLKIRKTDATRYNKAREFQRWVFSEVLPSMRKNNYYIDKHNITTNQLGELKDELILDFCAISKISLGRASEQLFGNKVELRKRLVGLGLLNYEECKFVQKKFKDSIGKEHDFFVVNISGTYDKGETKHVMQVSVTGAGYSWLKHKIKNDKSFGKTTDDLKLFSL